MSNSASKTKQAVQSIFEDVQYNKSSHPSCKKALSAAYKKSTIQEFLPQLLRCLEICLQHEEKSPNVERTLDFVADFAVSFFMGLGEEQSCPLLEGVFQFIFENHDCHVPLVRLRICQLMNRLLDNMGHDATVPEEVYNKIAESMLVRLQDCMSGVRTQAVYALHRLQEPANPDCEIIKAFQYHMTHDPCHDVRRAVIQKIAINKVTLTTVLTRMNDIKDSVRREAYSIINRFLVRQFTIKQRQLILQSGLGDRSEIIRDYMIDTLIPNWLKYFNNNYYDFLECIHIEKIPEVGIKLLKAIFGKLSEVMMEARVKDMCIVGGRVPYGRLDMVRVLYWRALAEHLRTAHHDLDHEQLFQQVMPDLTPFCQYIRLYFLPSQTASTSTPDQAEGSESAARPGEGSESATRPGEGSESATRPVEEGGGQASQVESTSQSDVDASSGTGGPHKPDEAVLVHLLEMCKVYDLADEMGRTSLQQLCVELLQSEHVTLESVPTLARLLDHAIPCPSTKLTVMAELVSELREPLQDNSEIYVPDLLLQEAEDKKTELTERMAELAGELEVVEQLGDTARETEIREAQANCRRELTIMNTVAPEEFGRNVNNDPETLKKCLTIVLELLKKGKINKMNPTLYSLMHNFLMPTLNLKIGGEAGELIKNLGLKVLSILCVLDVELAKEHFMMYCFNIANETLSVMALETVFDLLHVYGLATFNIEEPDEASISHVGSEEEDPRKPNLIVLLASLLNSESQQMRKTSVIGLCKLLFAGRIKSAELITKLIILWYSRIVENDAYIRQPLGVFFRMFATSCPHAPPLLLKAFLPTIKEFFKMEVTNPLSEVEVESVANLMVDFTRPGLNRYTPKDFHIHNQIALQVCEEVLTEELEPTNCLLLVKVLSALELNYSLTEDIERLSSLLTTMVKNVPKEDKMLVRLIMKYDMMVKVRQENNRTLSTVNNTLPPDVSTSHRSSGSQFLLSGRLTSGSESDGDGEGGGEEELSQDWREGCGADADDIEVPGTPDSSDSDLDSLFKGFCSLSDKVPKLSEKSDSDFKRPSVPAKPSRVARKTPKRTPSKTSSKPTMSPKKSKTPRKVISSPSKSRTKVISSPLKSRTAGNVRDRTPSKPKTVTGATHVGSPSKSISPKRTRTSSPVKSPKKTHQQTPPKKKTSAGFLLSSPTKSNSSVKHTSPVKGKTTGKVSALSPAKSTSSSVSRLSSSGSSMSSPPSSPVKGRRPTRTPAQARWRATALSPDTPSPSTSTSTSGRVTRSARKRQ